MFPLLMMEKRKIVSAVTHFKEKNALSGNIVDRVRVHYTDGSTKNFDVNEWEMTLSEGRRLWKQHEKDFKNPENFDG